MFKTLSNEQRLDQSFLQLLLDEIQKRGIYDSLFETSESPVTSKPFIRRAFFIVHKRNGGISIVPMLF
ncbi:hypothetical protein [Neobacillus cucumis]|uniref:hypothetical protein n=1 Tax=Neobacillus cucumis TaxID=1740721 RepID=UPI001962BF4B|nr:hypothetical protein [Neobacillus cucumis]MBM7651967.1 hypothetical protein [Neobacillus cucumis]